MLAEPISEKLDLASFLGSTEKIVPSLGLEPRTAGQEIGKAVLKRATFIHRVYSSSTVSLIDLIKILKRLSYQTRQIS